MPRAERGLAALFALLAVGSAAVVVATSGGGAVEAPVVAPAASAWRGLVGSRPPVALGNRVIVVLRTPSLAQRIERVAHATVTQERTWSSDAATAQRLLIARLAQRGVAVRPDYTFTRVLNGFSALLDPSAYPVVEADRDVAGVYPVRVAYPAFTSTHVLSRHRSRHTNVGVPGLGGRGVTIALLDIAARPGEMAGVVAGVAPAARVLPIRVGGAQPDGLGRSAIYARSDQIVAGLERAVDMNARIALVALAEPFAGFDDSPEAQAVAGATVLGTLVVAPSGNDGADVSGYGDIAGPGGAPAALTVGAIDTRARLDTMRVLIRSGLQTIFDKSIPIAGGARPARRLDLQVTRTGAALVRGGASPALAIERAAAAGASAILVYGLRTPLPAGSLGLDESVPVVSVSNAVARAVLRRLAAGGTATVTFDKVDSVANAAYGKVASFSSSGLAYDGRVKPELVAPGVGLATEDGSSRFVTVNGSSAAAAIVAGAAALVAQARPKLSARALKRLLVASPKFALRRARIRFKSVDLITSASLSDKEFTASDQAPTLLSVDVGRVIGEGGRIDIRPVKRLDISLAHANGSPIGLLVRVRDLLPGRYAFGITGRGPNGEVLAAGTYLLTISAYPVDGSPPSVRQLRFSLI